MPRTSTSGTGECRCGTYGRNVRMTSRFPKTPISTKSARIFKDSGLEGSFGTYRPNERQIDVYVYTFWKSSQAKYLMDQKRLVVEDRRFRWDHFLTGMQ